MGNCSSIFKTEEEEHTEQCSPAGPGLVDSLNNKAMATAPTVLASRVKQTATLIFLHGLGDTGVSWSEAFRDIQLPYVKYIFPTAKIQSISLNNGIAMHAWFDIKGLSHNAPEDEEGIVSSSKYIESLVAEEIKQGIPAERIVIGGFSQGGALALYTGATSSYNFGAVIMLSSWLLLHKKIASLMNPNNKKLKILQCHGTVDPLVPLQWAQLSFQHMQLLGFNNYIFKSYPGLMHASSTQEMDDVKQFIASVLPSV